eukprot:COSAG02_NODE_5996_length_3885_cov_1.818806_4_plen_71_part_00
MLRTNNKRLKIECSLRLPKPATAAALIEQPERLFERTGPGLSELLWAQFRAVGKRGERDQRLRVPDVKVR